MPTFLLKQFQAPGDLIAMTPFLHDLKKNLRNTTIYIHSCYPEVFYNNHDVITNISEELLKTEEIIDMSYGKWTKENRGKGYHVTDAFYGLFEEFTGIRVFKSGMFPRIFLTDEEKDPSFLDNLGITKPYWIVNAGFKSDMPLKLYPPYMWQKIINYLNLQTSCFCNRTLVQAGHSHHMHPELRNVVNLIGKTDNLRDYFKLMYHAQGSIGHVSLHMHVAAAFHKPCVILAGGREEARWEHYLGHRFLDTIGLLECCRETGCWRVGRSQCKKMNGNHPSCFYLVSPEWAVEAVLSYCKNLIDVGKDSL